MRKTVTVPDWTLAVVPHAAVVAGFDARTADEVLHCPHPVLPATVPGNFELDLMKAGLLEDLYYGENILQAQQLEDRHLWYTARFTLEKQEDHEPFLTFGGIDAAGEIFLDGNLLGETDNALIPHTFSLKSVAPGNHEIVVHIRPAALYSRQNPVALGCSAQPYNFDSLSLRRAPYTYGWDIMPRIVTAGLWKPVTVEYKPVNRLEEIYLFTASLTGDDAVLNLSVRVEGDALIPGELTFSVEGVCEDSRFSASEIRLPRFCSCAVLKFPTAVNG